MKKYILTELELKSLVGKTISSCRQSTEKVGSSNPPEGEYVSGSLIVEFTDGTNITIGGQDYEYHPAYMTMVISGVPGLSFEISKN